MHSDKQCMTLQPFTDDLASELLDSVTAQVEFRSHRTRLHRQMLALLPRFCFSEKWSKQLKTRGSQGGGQGQDKASDVSLVFQEIASNITAFCRAVITESSESGEGWKRWSPYVCSSVCFGFFEWSLVCQLGDWGQGGGGGGEGERWSTYVCSSVCFGFF